MSAEILFLISFVSLCLGWFFWLTRGREIILPLWRKILVSAGMTALIISVLLFPLFLIVVRRAEIENEPFATQLSTLLRIVRIGFFCADFAMVICWFAVRKSRVFFAVSSVTIWFLWLAQAMGV